MPENVKDPTEKRIYRTSENPLVGKNQLSSFKLTSSSVLFNLPLNIFTAGKWCDQPQLHTIPLRVIEVDKNADFHTFPMTKVKSDDRSWKSAFRSISLRRTKIRRFLKGEFSVWKTLKKMSKSCLDDFSSKLSRNFPAFFHFYKFRVAACWNEWRQPQLHISHSSTATLNQSSKIRFFFAKIVLSNDFHNFPDGKKPTTGADGNFFLRFI